MSALRGKRLAVAVAVAFSVLLSSCLIDWDSLRDDGGVSDANDDRFEPSDAARDTARDALDDKGASDAGASDAIDERDAPDDVNAADASACAYVFAGTLATFDFTGQPGNQISTAPTSIATGLTVGSVSRSSAIVAAAGANSINASSWATSSTLDGTRYFTLTITPPAMCALDLTSLTLDDKASGTGPATGALATSVDAFAATTTFATGAVSTVSSSVANATTSVEVRIYGYAAIAAAGTFRIQNTLTISGKLN